MDGSEADAAAGLKAIPKEEAVVTNNTPTADEEEEEMHKLASKRARDKHKPSEEEPLSRRQKRQKLNEKNKWPQHPKIMNPERRVKAYLRVAGVEEIDEDDTEIPVDKPAKKTSDEDEDEWRRFGRFLGGTDARTRHKAVKRLGHYLQAKSGFDQEDISNVDGLSELDLMKLWKGLWYTLYMADKAPVQDELAKHLSKLLWCLSGSLEDDEGYGQAYLDWEAQEELEMEQQMALLGDKDEDSDDESDEDVKILDARYVELEEEESADEEEVKGSDDDQEDEEGSEGSDNHEDEDEEGSYDENEKFFRGAPLVALMIKTFYKTLLREWGNMDKYRVDKFYALVRYMTREMYRYMATRQWNLGIIKIMNDTIVDEALAKPPNGVRYHLIDIALEELSRVVHKTDCLPLTEAIFLEIMEPFFQLAMHGAGDKTVQARAFENVLKKFLKEYSVVSEFDDEGRKQKEKQILEEVHVGTIAQYIFDIASAEDTLHIHRKGLYDMHKEYKRQLQKVGKDVEIGVFKLDDEDAIMEDGEEVHSHDDDIMESESAEDHANSEDEEAPPPKKVKNNKKKKKDKKQKKQALDDKDEASKNRKPASDNKKKGKKKTEDGKGSAAYEMQMDWTRHSDDKDAGKESKKKNKGKKQEHDTKQDEEVAEETVTISISDQKKAKKALKKQQEQQQNKEADNEESGSKSKKKDKKKKDKGKSNKEKDKKRRVSWNTKNQARSWKASMQGLKTMKPPKTLLASKTPSESILLNKDKESPSNTSAVTQKARKRATDYF